MPRPKLSVPAAYDPCDNVWMRMPRALIPMVGGLFALLEWRASWQPEDYDDGYQIAMLLQGRLAMSECESSILEALDAIRVCVCQTASVVDGLAGSPAIPAPDGWPNYDDGSIDLVVVDQGDPPAGFDTWDEWKAHRCQAIQWLVTSCIELVTWVQEALLLGQSVGWAALMATLLSLGLIVPVVAVVAVVALLVTRAMAFDWAAQQAWLEAHYLDLVCAVVNAADSLEAKANIDDVFSTWDTEDLGPADLARLAFSNWAINRLFDGSLELPESIVYNPENCQCLTSEDLICQQPINPDVWTGDVYKGSNQFGDFLGFGGGSWPDCTYPSAETVEWEDSIDGTYRVLASVTWFSGYNYGATAGYVTLLGYDPSDQQYHTIHAVTCVTLNVAGTIFNNTPLSDPIDLSPYTRFKLTANNQPGACRDDPYLAFNVLSACFTIDPQ